MIAPTFFRTRQFLPTLCLLAVSYLATAQEHQVPTGKKYGFVLIENELKQTVYVSGLIDVGELDCAAISPRIHNGGKQGSKIREDYEKREDEFFDECAIASFKKQLKKKEPDFAGYRTFFIRRSINEPARNAKCNNGSESECYLTKAMAEKTLAENLEYFKSNKWKVIRK